MAHGKRVSAENPQLRYVLTYPVRETFRAAPKYHLVFVTRSDKGIPVMNDLLCIEDDDLYERTESPTRFGQVSLFGDPCVCQPGMGSGSFSVHTNQET
jgi:hypothetical protein